jgi:hypothetical protein
MLNKLSSQAGITNLGKDLQNNGAVFCKWIVEKLLQEAAGSWNENFISFSYKTLCYANDQFILLYVPRAPANDGYDVLWQ